MNYRLALLVLGAVLAFGCGDDDDDDDATDGGGDANVTVSCPMAAPAREQLMGPCCSRATNASRPNAPELRLAAIEISSPASLANQVVGGLLKAALEEERFNWLIRLDGLDGSMATIRTGYGERNDDNTFSFVDGTAPSPGDPDRWNPAMTSITVDGEMISAAPLDEAFTLPVFDEMKQLQLELPLNALELKGATLTEGRDCIGSRTGSRYVTEGDVTTYITVEAASAGMLMIGGAINTTLCMFTAGLSAEPNNCDMYPRITTTACTMENAAACGTRMGGPGGTCVTNDGGMFCGWPFPPDSMCDEDGCRKGGCDPYDDEEGCNAWELSGTFAAHAVEITN